jgi:electron transfer flavoprotein alpha subunit
MAKGGVLVFIEQVDGAMEDVSIEVLGKGREIADRLGVPLTAVVLGHDVGGIAKDCSRLGPDVVILAGSPLLKDFTTEAYTKVIGGIIAEKDPDILLVGATHNGTSLAASLAVRLKAGLMAHVVDLELEEGTKALLGSVPGFGGSIVAVCKCRKGRPQIATVRPGVFRPAAPGIKEGKIVTWNPDLAATDVRSRVVERHVEKTADIGRAEMVVVAGLGCRENLSAPKKLAETMGATWAVSRPLADKGLATKDLVVGSTGTGLSAKLAVVVGVSGAAHFSSGIRDVGTVVAINSDPQAQIFKQADYIVVGDAGQLLPKLIQELGGSKS